MARFPLIYCFAVALPFNIAAPASAVVEEWPENTFRTSFQFLVNSSMAVQFVRNWAIVNGTYQGFGPDVRQRVETVRMVSPDIITMQRNDYASAPLLFHRIGPDLFRNHNGSTIIMLSATEFRWTSSNGEITVHYRYMP